VAGREVRLSTYRTDETGVSLQVEIESEGVHDVGIDDGTYRFNVSLAVVDCSTHRQEGYLPCPCPAGSEQRSAYCAVHVSVDSRKDLDSDLLGANDKRDLWLGSAELVAGGTNRLEFVIDHMDVLTLGDTITVDDDLLRERLGVGLEELEVFLHHAAKVFDDFTELSATRPMLTDNLHPAGL
jgi:hypothetical protein